MKKILLMIPILFIFLSAFLALPTEAAKTPHYLDIDADTLQEIQALHKRKEDLIVKCYAIDIVLEIYEGQTFETVAKNPNIQTDYLCITPERVKSPEDRTMGGITSYYRNLRLPQKPVWQSSGWTPYNEILDTFLLGEALLQSKLGNIRLLDQYCFCDGYSDVCVYYITDRGSYVYFREEIYDTVGCLFTLEEFYELAVQFQAFRFENGHLDGGVPLEYRFDLSAYKVTFPASPNTADHSLGILLAALAGGAALTTLRRKRQ